MRMVVDFAERASSLRKEGYQELFSATTPGGMFRKMKHFANGNIVVLKCLGHVLIQTTNGKEVHRQTYE